MRTKVITDAVNNYINGNITDVKKAIKRMNKAEFCDFIFGIEEDYVHDFIDAIDRAKRLSKD